MTALEMTSRKMATFPQPEVGTSDQLSTGIPVSRAYSLILGSTQNFLKWKECHKKERFYDYSFCEIGGDSCISRAVLSEDLKYVCLVMFVRKNHTGKFKGWNKWPKWNNIIDLQIYVWTKYNWKMDCYMYLTRIKTCRGFITRDVLKTYLLSQLRIY